LATSRPPPSVDFGGQIKNNNEKEIRRGGERMPANRIVVIVGLSLFLTMGVSGQKPAGFAAGSSGLATGAKDQTQTVSPRSSVDIRVDPGRLPLSFIPLGRGPGYVVRGRDKSIYLTPGGMTLAMANSGGRRESDKGGEAAEASRGGRWIVKLDFLGASSGIEPLAENRLDTTFSFFKGRPEEWRSGVPAYGRVVYPGLWPGIDLVFSGTFDRLKYEFIVHPGADLSRIRLAYRGVERLAIDTEGRLEVNTEAGGFSDDTPVAWQEGDGKRSAVPVSYTIGPGGAPHEFGFEVGAYDQNLPLVLDPAVFIHAGYFGGGSSDTGYAMALDSSGNIYITGDTTSTETISFPATVGPDLTYNSGDDAFVVKLSPGAASIVYCGYIGGGLDDWGNGIAVDSAGNAYVTGETLSSPAAGFPVIVGPDLTYGGGTKDAFIAKVKANGTALDYCGYLGGSAEDFGLAVAADSNGNAYVTGNTYSTQSTGFPVLTGPDVTANGQGDAFVCKIDSSGSFVYSGFIGGNTDDFGRGIAVDSSGNAYVTGRTSSISGFPATVGPDLTYNNNSDCFVAKVNPGGTGLVYCGYIGGAASDDGKAIAVDSAGNAYVTGSTTSTASSFPVLVGPDLTSNGSSDGFIAKVNSGGTALVYCGYIGGSGSEEALAIALDAAGHAFVCGYTNSTQTTFPVKAGPDLTYASGVYDGFAARVNAAGSALDYCGYIGGTDTDTGRGIALDRSGNAWVTGWTNSSFLEGFPNTGFIISDLRGLQDAFLVNISYYDERVSSQAVGDFNGDGKDEAAIDFGPNGAWMYDGSGWSQLTAADPEGLTPADVDGDGAAEVLADLGSLGLWLWNAGAWNQLSGVNADGISAGDIDSDSAAEVVGDFGVSGLWLLDGGIWTQLSGVNADYASVGNVDGLGGAEIVGDFGNTGLWLWNAGAWLQLSGVNVDYFVFGNTDGMSGQDIIADFGTTGLWQFAGGAWSQLSGVNSDFILTADLDGDGLDEVAGNFPESGLWLWNNGTWNTLSSLAVVTMTAANIDSDPAEELAAGFGGVGLFLYDAGSWTAIGSIAPEYLFAGDLDGDSRDEILADMGSIGLWLWDSGAWSQISSLNPN
jgi:hypothetical protein